jgi:hypothetical protein
MFRCRLCVFVSLTIFITANAFAQDISEKQRQALNNLQHELSNCAMFYQISAEGNKRNGSANSAATSKQAHSLKEQSLAFAITIGNMTGMSLKGMKARLELSFDRQMNEMDNNFVNYSILLKQYVYTCADLLKNITDRAERALMP